MRARETLLWLFGGLFDKLTRYMGACGFILYDSGGGGGTTTTVTSNIPDWLQDPTKRMVARGEALTGPDAQYQAYNGPRVAGMTDGQNAAYQQVSGMGTPSQYGQASNALTGAMNSANSLSAYGPGNFTAFGYNANTVDPNNPSTQMQAAQMGAAGPVGYSTWDANTAAQYMSPYQQGVTDISKRMALQEGQIGLNTLAANAARNGAFGGSRFGLEEAKAYNDLGQRLSDIQTQGLQSAYTTGMGQFNADQARRQSADQFNAGNQQATNLANAQFRQQAGQMNAGQGLQALLANQSALNAASQFGGQNAMTAQQMAEQSRQYGNDANLRAADLAARTGLSAASQYAGLGAQQQSDALARANALNTLGTQQQATNQKQLDTNYEDFINARDFERNNLQFLSGLLRGNPVSTSQSTIAPTASTASQLGGLGLAGLGAYKMFSG
jgi:hypothetical protein